MLLSGEMAESITLSWEKVPNSPAAFILSIAFVGNKLYVSTKDFHVYVTPDFGASWSKAGDGLPQGHPSVNMFATNKHSLLATVVFRGKAEEWRLNGGAWTHSTGGDRAYYLNDHTFDGKGNILELVQCSDKNGAGQIRRSTDDGKAFTWLSNIMCSIHKKGCGFYCLATSPEGVIYAGSEHDGCHLSTDAGLTWHWAGPHNGNDKYPVLDPLGNVNSIHFNAAGQPVITCGQGSIWVHEGGLESTRWKKSDYPHYDTFAYQPKDCKSTDPTDMLLFPDGTLLVHGHRMFTSADGGLSWTENSAGFPKERLAYDPYSQGLFSITSHNMAAGPDGRVYVGIPTAAGLGVWRTTAAIFKPGADKE